MKRRCPDCYEIIVVNPNPAGEYKCNICDAVSFAPEEDTIEMAKKYLEFATIELEMYHDENMEDYKERCIYWAAEMMQFFKDMSLKSQKEISKLDEHHVEFRPNLIFN